MKCDQITKVTLNYENKIQTIYEGKIIKMDCEQMTMLKLRSFGK